MDNDLYLYDPTIKKVSKEDFIGFINKYPRKLTQLYDGSITPPLITYHDFEMSTKWLYSIVAATFDYDFPDGIFYQPEVERIYRILKNAENIFVDMINFRDKNIEVIK